MSKPLSIRTPTKIKAMKLDLIKKTLYKEKPTAKLNNIGKLFYRFLAQTSIGEIEFHVPVSEMGEIPFGDTEQAQLLIRWIVL
jgi:hypothetical protein